MAGRVHFGVAAAVLLLTPGAPAQEPSTFDDDVKRAAVEAAAGHLRDRYIFPDVGEQAAAAIESALDAGDYEALIDRRAFAEALTDDLRAATNDKHLSVFAPGPAPSSEESRSDGPLRSEGGVTRADRLPGGVGYIEIFGFPNPELFKIGVDRAMAALSETSALIIDVRRNGGGSPVSVSYLVSHFLSADEPVLINEFVNRTPGTREFTREEFWSSEVAHPYRDRPVYVLTSGRTFSGGEEFAYDIQVMDLGVLVGETTGGGANPGGTLPLGAGMALFVPSGRAENPVTGANWEGVGVSPDVATPPDDALRVALAELGQLVEATDIDELSQARLFTPRDAQHPDTEAAVRRLIAEAAAGEPNYDLMTEGMAEVAREQRDALQGRLAALGELETVAFVEVDPRGADVYDLGFANGPLRLRVALAPDGRTAMASIAAAPAPTESQRTAAFSANDADGDGRLDRTEYQALFRALGGDPALLDDYFGQRDADGDGFVTAAEYAPAIAP